MCVRERERQRQTDRDRDRDREHIQLEVERSKVRRSPGPQFPLITGQLVPRIDPCLGFGCITVPASEYRWCTECTGGGAVDAMLGRRLDVRRR